MPLPFRLLSSIGLGAALMYLFDPERGKARRSQIGDKVKSTAADAEHSAEKLAQNIRNRAAGMKAKMSNTEQAVDDDVLVARIRSALGHVTSHADRVEVEVSLGYATLRGELAEADIEKAIECAEKVDGVIEVDNQLQPLVTS